MEEAVRAFLLCCLRARRDPGAQAALGAAARRAALDWEALWRTANAERLAPLIHHVLRDTGIVPPAIAKRLADSYRFAGFRNMALLHELGGVIDQLAANGIPVIVLKGAALAEAVYGNLSLRPMGDIDLLLHRSDVTPARRVLAALKYDLVRAETRAGAAVAYENEVLLRKAAGFEVLLELHWSLFDSPYYQDTLDLTWWWKTAVPLPIGTASAQMLGPEAQVLHLCGHLALHHGGDGLLWLHDIAEVVAGHARTLHWAALLARAQRDHLVLPLQQGLGRVADEWGAPIPPGVLEQVRALRPSRREARVFAWLSRPERTVAQRLWADLRSFSDWGAARRFATTSLFPSPAYMRQRYRIPHWLLLPLYYPYRWLRGLLSAL